MNCVIFLLAAVLVLGALLIYFLRRRLEETRAWVAGLETELQILRRQIETGAPAAGERAEEPVVEPTDEDLPPQKEDDAPTVGSVERESSVETLELESPWNDEVAEMSEEALAGPPARPPIRIDWEQWIGVRGAALLGGIVLALAAVLFLKFSIERGLIPPIVRVALGLVTGIGALVGSELLRKRDYSTTANSLAGAGIVILYASIWAARSLYELIPVSLAFVFMILVTVVCGLLSWRHRSLVIAVLGLVGGFATPLLLSSGSNRPVGLFGYILMLNLGLLTLARRQRWPLLGALGLVGTVLYQLLWIFGRMEPGQALLGLMILGLFGLLFAAVGATGPGGGEPLTWRLTSWAGVLFPFVFSVYFAARATLDIDLWQLGLFLAILAVAALELGRLHDQPLLGTGAAAASVGVFFVWTIRATVASGVDHPQAWEMVGVAFVLALLFHLRGRAGARDTASAEGPAPVGWLSWVEPGLIASLGLLGSVILASVANSTPLWPWLAGWLAIAALLVQRAWAPGRGRRLVVAASALALAFFFYFAAHGAREVFPAPAIFFGLALAVAVGFQFIALKRGSVVPSTRPEVAAAVFALLLLLGLSVVGDHPALDAKVFFATTLLLALLAFLAATRAPMGVLYALAVGLLALGHTTWVEESFRWDVPPARALGILVTLMAAAALASFWPFVAGKRFARDRWVLYSAALAAPAWFPALRKVWTSRFGDGAIGALPLLLGLMALGASALARRQFGVEEPERKRSLVWFLAVALGFVTLAIPLQLDREWVTIAWALQGVAMMVLWKRLDHPGLKYFGLALLATTFVRLVLNPEILGYYEKSARPIFNWLMYTYLVPAAALLGASRVLAPLEVERRRSWEPWSRVRPIASAACGLGAILVTFAWINLTILDYFSPGGPLRLALDRLPARDLSLSLAWAIYALALLAVGMARKSVGLRWVSLAFLILTIGKVFLYDLGELKDLYRVASLVGLAVSLLLVSLAYQRFVFGDRQPNENESNEAPS